MYTYRSSRFPSSDSDDSVRDNGSDGSSQAYPDDDCIRCGQKVYHTERMEVGVHLHRSCFRCYECDVVLSLNTFILARVPGTGIKDVFCKSHSPKPSNSTLDPDAIGIRLPMRSQQISKNPSFNTQVRLRLKANGKQPLCQAGHPK